jgi:hypothetical protein
VTDIGGAKAAVSLKVDSKGVSEAVEAKEPKAEAPGSEIGPAKTPSEPPFEFVPGNSYDIQGGCSLVRHR